MTAVCFYFHVHQPHRLKRYRIFDIGKDREYFNDRGESDVNNARVFDKVARKCYLPTNQLLLDLLRTHPEFKISFSITGTVMEQMDSPHTRYGRAVAESFRELFATGRVEIVGETYYHSLAALYSPAEFKRQVEKHGREVKRRFGVVPQVFRNTELIYSNDIAKLAADLGFKAILAEGADRVLGWRSPNFVYKSAAADIGLLLKNYKLSDDIAFRFSDRNWSQWPLSANTFTEWINAVNGSGDVINLFMDYETFGEHQWEDTGIFNFMRALPPAVYQHPDNSFVTVSEAAERYPTRAELDIPELVSWADMERDVSAWLGNDMQKSALARLYQHEEALLQAEDESLLADWRALQTSDHFYYMCTKYWSDGDVHKYFSPYESPYEAYMAFMNVMHDFELRLEEAKEKSSLLTPTT